MKEFHTQHRWHYAILIGLILTTLISGYVVFGDREKQISPDNYDITEDTKGLNNENESVKVEEQTKIIQASGEKEAKNIAENKNETHKDQPQTISEESNTSTSLPKESTQDAQKATEKEISSPKAGISATLIINGSRFETSVEENATIYDLMVVLSHEGAFSLSTRNFGGSLGYFVEAINGTKNTNDHVWIYYINGQKATVGISNYKLKSNDIISWNYEASTL